jgi:hypothetical protein
LKKYGWNMDGKPILPGVKDGPGFGRKALSGADVGSDGGQEKALRPGFSFPKQVVAELCSCWRFS